MSSAAVKLEHARSLKCTRNQSAGLGANQTIMKNGRLQIPKRDRSVIAKARPCLAHRDASHSHQVQKAFNKGFKRYEKALQKLSEL